MTRPRARRDFVLDSGAVSHFASHERELVAWLRIIDANYSDPMVYLPVSILSETRTGMKRYDTGLNRLIGLITNPDSPNAHWLVVEPFIGDRAGVLRTQAISHRRGRAKGAISPTDAEVVALAEWRSEMNPVTIVTSDPKDIQLLVDITGSRNIGVQAI